MPVSAAGATVAKRGQPRPQRHGAVLIMDARVRATAGALEVILRPRAARGYGRAHAARRSTELERGSSPMRSPAARPSVGALKGEEQP